MEGVKNICSIGFMLVATFLVWCVVFKELSFQEYVKYMLWSILNWALVIAIEVTRREKTYANRRDTQSIISPATMGNRPSTKNAVRPAQWSKRS